MSRPALLALADGTCFKGTAIGIDGQTVGEVVFNTAMTGYQEILTDPSYSQQLVTLTYPHIGNTGCNSEDTESTAVMASGLIVRNMPTLHSNWRSTQSLGDYLQEHKICAIADIDTRALTRHLRDGGAQAGCIVSGHVEKGADVSAAAVASAKAFPGLAGLDLAKAVSCKKTYDWAAPSNIEFHVVAMDFGIKHNILRMLADRGCQVTVVPAQTPATDVLAMKPDGVFLSNGPGDPEPCDYAITAIQNILETKLPVFGICLGHQLLALASGAETLKMKFGHHGANHPVQDTASGRVLITSQNHGFAVNPDTLNNNIAITHVSLFDQSLQGIKRLDVPAFSFQGHPEASPGPHDVDGLFDQFIQLMQSAKHA
ncbi:MAG: glutamine-hydrolyzing carbamoyl-phosphate synthase small subunit [Granulosicoccaceae bacterium]